jgi:uncharacterized protein (DUF2236 family)
MQLAHPMVAAGVADHSDFRSDPFGRLWNTLDVTLTIGFGDRERAAAAAQRVATTHASVRGARGDARYRAGDPDLLAWIHATLVDSAIETYERFVGRVGCRARDRYLVEMHEQARAFGVPADRLWPSYPAFRGYVDGLTATLRVDAEARALGDAVMTPATTASLRPVLRLLRSVTAGLLPAPLREPFGLTWSDRDERRLDVLAASVRWGGALLPDALRRWPHAREADERLLRTSSHILSRGRLRAAHVRGSEEVGT